MNLDYGPNIVELQIVTALFGIVRLTDTTLLSKIVMLCFVFAFCCVF